MENKEKFDCKRFEQEAIKYFMPFAVAVMPSKEAFISFPVAIIFIATGTLVINTGNILFAKGFGKMCLLVGWLLRRWIYIREASQFGFIDAMI